MTHYSIIRIDKKNPNKAKQRLIDYFLLSDHPDSYKGKYISAFVADNKSGRVLHQYEYGVEVKITNPILLS